MPKIQPPVPQNYTIILKSIKERIVQAQYDALKVVNKELIGLYWYIGKMIVDQQEQQGWGKAIVERLALDLQKAFPGTRGFSARNLWYMRTMYLEYHLDEKLQTLSAEISWSHNMAILEKCDNNLEREFYIRMSRKNHWSYRVLLNHIENQDYEKTMLNQTSFDRTLPANIKDIAKMSVKDEYTFSFLELDNDYTERVLENELVLNIEAFLKEMGGAFAFVGRQYRLDVDDTEYFIDILLYHRPLKCFVAIELKVGEFIPEYVGKMQFYLAALDRLVKLPEENPSIGIILCKSKKKTRVEYALKETKKPIGVASYTVVKKLPKELKSQLPTVEQIAILLDKIDKN